MDKTCSITPLVRGYERFKEKYFSGKCDLYSNLVSEGQQPKVLIVGCCDSRVDPSIVFDCSPGDIFMIRNVANIVPPCEHDGHYHGTSAALQFGVCSLGIQDIVVLGHSHCGGIQALMKEKPKPDPYDFVSEWMSIADEARETVLATHSNKNFKEQAHACEKEGILVSLKNLRSFPWVTEREKKGSLSLHGWHFNLESGIIKAYDPQKKSFTELVID